MAILIPGHNEEERRESPRISAGAIRDLRSVKVQSELVNVINASRRGLLVECGFRLLPGAGCSIDVLLERGRSRVRGRVVRSEIASVARERLVYRVAFELHTPLEFLEELYENVDSSAQDELITLPALELVTFVQNHELETALALNAW